MFEKLITKFKKSPSEESSQHSDDSLGNVTPGGEGDEEKKKKKSMIIKVVVVLGLVYLALDSFVFNNKDEENKPSAKEETAKAPKEKRPRVKKNKNKETVTVENANPANPVEDKNKVLANNPADAKKEEKKEDQKSENPPIENINITPKDKVAVDIGNEVKKEEIAKEELPKIEIQKHEKNSATKVPSVGEVKTKEKQIDNEIDKLIDAEEKKTNPKSESKVEVDLKDKIVADDNYISPPNYELLGRGLVYNCKEKFWACIDKAAYLDCNKNMKYNKLHAKALECAVVNVYSSVEDCNLIQKYNVNNMKNVEVCN